MKKLCLITASFVTATTLSCKPAGNSGSDVKTLDQMASGSDASYSCAASGTANNGYVSEVAMKHVLLSGGVPCSESKGNPACKAMQDVLNIIASRSDILVRNYFDTIKGNISLSNENVETLCQSSFSDPNSPQFIKDDLRRKIDGCWSIPKGADGKYVVAMVHKQDAESIRRNAIRVFGMFYGQAVQQMVKQSDGQFAYDLNYSPSDGPRKNLWDAKKNLASLFLKDVAAASKPGSNYNLEKLPFLKRSLTADDKAKLANGQGALDDSLFENNKVYYQRFVDTVMGQAFDSGFCQAEANIAANKTSFKETMGVFNNQILPQLQDLAIAMGTAAGSQPAAQPSVANGNGQSFGLGMSGFFGALASMMGTPNTGVGTMPGSANPAAAAAYNNLNMNPTNNPAMTQYYNPALAQSANPNAPNYNPALLAQQRQQLQQQAMPTGTNPNMGSGMFGGLFGPAPTSFATNNQSSDGLFGALANMQGSRVCPNCPDGTCSNCTGGVSGSNCPNCTGGTCSTCNLS